MYRHREFRMVETERLTVSEWTSEGSPKAKRVGRDGYRTRYKCGAYDGM